MEPDNRIALAEYEAMIEYIQKDLLSNEPVQDDIARKDKTEIAVKTKQQGNKLIERGDYVGAKAKFTTAIKLDSNDPTFYANRAICHMKLMDFKKAENDCDKALELDWKYVKAYIRRARIRRKLGKMYEARQDLYNAHEVNPNDSTILDELEELDEVIRKIEETRRRKGIVVEEEGIVSLLESRKASGSSNKMITLKWNELRPKIFQLKGNDEKLTPKDDPISGTFVNGNNVPASPTVTTEEVEDGEESKKELLTQGVKDNSGSSKNHGQVKNNIACYNMKEVFPLQRNDPAAKFSGTFFKVRVEDAKFAVPETLLEVPDGLIF
uniref:Serine/threonine-protein phosphatase T n=2 Tax=Lygus hesperus TaxID=30085 RepID=A0A0A9VSJ7_LYGHE